MVNTPIASWAERVRHFTPSWFAVSMSIGIQVPLFHFFPFPGQHQTVLDIIATVILVFSDLLFIVLCAFTLARYVMYPRIWSIMIHHPVQGLFVGCFPMALSMVINGLSLEIYEKWGFRRIGFLYFIWALWWINVVVSISCNFGMFYVMITRHTYEIHKSSALWLLPVVPTIVCGISGGIIAAPIQDISLWHGLITTLMSGFLLGLGLTMSIPILCLYISRLILHGFPDPSLSASLFLPLGPLGQGGYGIMLLGNTLVEILPRGSKYVAYLPSEAVATALGVICFVLGLILWIFGFWFLVPSTFALLSSKKLTFGLPWWGLIFPAAIYTLLTIEIGEKIDSKFIKGIGAAYAIVVYGLTLFFGVRTAHVAWQGSVFNDPALIDAAISTVVVDEKPYPADATPIDESYVSQQATLTHCDRPALTPADSQV